MWSGLQQLTWKLLEGFLQTALHAPETGDPPSWESALISSRLCDGYLHSGFGLKALMETFREEELRAVSVGSAAAEVRIRRHAHSGGRLKDSCISRLL
jgi:hypothetical protein